MLQSIKFVLSRATNANRHYPLFMGCGIISGVVRVWLGVVVVGAEIFLLQSDEYVWAGIVAIMTATAFFLLNTMSSYCSYKLRLISLQTGDELNVKVFQRIFRLDYEKQEKEETKRQFEFANTAINEMGVVKMSGLIQATVEACINIVVAGVAMTFFNAWILLMVVIVAGINVFSELFRMRCQYELNQQTAELEWNMYYVRDYLSTSNFAKETRVFGMREYVLNKLKSLINKYTELRVRSEMRFIKRFWISFLLDGILLAGVYSYGIILYMDGKMNVSSFAVYLSSMTALTAAMISFVKSITGFAEGSRYLRELQSFLGLSATSGETISSIEAIDDSTDTCTVKAFPIDIEFRNVSFRYPEAEADTLHEVSFHIRKGEKIAIVGKNGAGKTTLVYLLLRIHKLTSGQILINGKDQGTYSDEELYRLFSVVLQDYAIYPYSVYENIYMNKEGDPLRADECLSLVGMRGKIDSLRLGGNTRLSRLLDEDGVDFSGGEKQRLAMSRALYHNGSAFIMDEPTAALSPQSEYDLYMKLSEIANSKTALFISHRMAICRLCDRILVLNGGKVDQFGTHEELMTTGGLYASMFRAQAESFEG